MCMYVHTCVCVVVGGIYMYVSVTELQLPIARLLCMYNNTHVYICMHNYGYYT